MLKSVALSTFAVIWLGVLENDKNGVFLELWKVFNFYNAQIMCQIYAIYDEQWYSVISLFLVHKAKEATLFFSCLRESIRHSDGQLNKLSSGSYLSQLQ